MDLGSIVLTVVILIGAALARTASKLVDDEIKAWLPYLAARIKNCAIRVLPKDDRDRYSEEWQEYMSTLPGDLGRVIVAINFNIVAYRHRFDLIFNLDRAKCANFLFNMPQAGNHYHVAVELYHPLRFNCPATGGEFKPSSPEDFERVREFVAKELSDSETQGIRRKIFGAFFAGECIPGAYLQALEPIIQRMRNEPEISSLKDDEYWEKIEKYLESLEAERIAEPLADQGNDDLIG